jgi:hypothetical protein
MTKSARIVGGVAADVVDGNPHDFFHPDIAATFVEVPDKVQIGWRKVGNGWKEPAPDYETTSRFGGGAGEQDGR